MKKQADRVGIFDRFGADSLARVAVAVALGFSACALVAPMAGAAIVPGQGVAGVKLGDSEGKVRGRLGKPFAVDHYHGVTVLRYGKPFLGTLSLKHHEVDGILTVSKNQKTDKGVGPGSSYAQTTSAYPEASCSEGTWGPDSSTCVLKSEYKGRAVETDFVFYDVSLPMREVDLAFK